MRFFPRRFPRSELRGKYAIPGEVAFVQAQKLRFDYIHESDAIRFGKLAGKGNQMRLGLGGWERLRDDCGDYSADDFAIAQAERVGFTERLPDLSVARRGMF